jgi:drug/metabolite transporter (DMT)-like permease
MILVAAVASRSQGIVGTAVLGLTGGFGYAVVGISARLLPDSLTLPHLVRSPATYSLACGGVLAFFLYSLALQRGSVTAATTSLITTQTVTPAVVGVILLGDHVRHGWWPGAAIGFLITAAAAIVLVRFEGVRDVENVEAEERHRHQPAGANGSAAPPDADPADDSHPV